MVVDGCPGLMLTDDACLLYRLFSLAYTPIRASERTFYQRHLAFAEMLDLPMWLVDALQAIEAELLLIQAERKDA